MNRIKHFMILALALAMSLGAWAQTTVTWTEADLIGSSDQTTFTKDGVTITCSDRISGGMSFNGPVTISTTLGNFTSIAITGAYANAPTTADGFTNDGNVSTWTGNAASISTPASIAYAAQFVFTIAADASPTVTHNTDGSWGFTMPDYNAALNVTYYSLPALAWTLGGSAIPNDTTITAYYGFHQETMQKISFSMGNDFLTYITGLSSAEQTALFSLLVDSSSNPAVVAIGLQGPEVVGPGECDIYSIFRGNDDFLADTAAFHLTILNPDTLTLAANGNGTVSPLMGGGSTLLTTINASDNSSFTSGSQTFDGVATVTLSGSNYLSNGGNYYGWFCGGSGNTATVAVEPMAGYTIDSVKFYPADGGVGTDTEAPFVATVVTGQGSGDIHTYLNGTSIGGRGVKKIEVYGAAAGSDSIVASTTEGQYLVIPGATVQVVAEAQDGNYVSAWSDNRQPQHYTSDTNTITVSGSMNLTATFAQNPLLTLEANGQGSVELDGYTPDETTYDITIEGGNTYTNVSFPYQTTVSLHNLLMQVNGANPVIINSFQSYGSADATITISEPFDGSRTISYYYDEIGVPKLGSKTITCTANHSDAVYPDGVTAGTGANTYRVLPGTQLSVTATPAEGSYLAQWSDGTQTEPVEGDARLGGSHPYTMPATQATLTATFNQIPVLTLASNNSEWGTVEMPLVASPETLLTTINASGSFTSGSQTFGDVATVTFAGQTTYEWSVWMSQYGEGKSGTITLSAAEGVNVTRYKLYFNYADPYTITASSATLNLYCEGSGRHVYYLGEEIGYEGISMIKVYGTVSALPAGVEQLTADTYRVLPGTQLSVTATPDSAHYFVNWDEETALNSNTAVEKTLTMGTAPATLTANFAAKPTLTLAQNESQWGEVTLEGYSSGTGSGTTLPDGVVAIGDNTYRVDYNTEVTVNAEATALHHVSGWQDQGGTELTGATYSDYFITTPENLFPAKSALTLTMTTDATARALFGINSYDVTASVAPTTDLRGTVSATYTDPQGAQQSAAAGASLTLTAQGGSTTTLTATPQTGYHFVGWMDNQNTQSALNTQNPLTMTEAGSYTAVFDTNVYQISGSVATASSQWGSVEGSGEYRHFTTATLTAMPIEHYHFVRWEDGNTQNPRIIDVTGEESHEAEFAIDRFIVAWSSNDETMGLVVGPYDNHTTGDPIPRLQGSYGTQFNLTASPTEHHMLDHWSTGQTSNVITVTITENAEIVAYFKHVPYNVTVASADETMGSVSGSQESVEWQASTEISATAEYGYHFVQWNDGNTANPRTVTINEEHDYSFTATFAKNQYTVTVVTGDATRGSVSGTTTVDYLTNVQISATANEHYHFEQWEDGSTDNPRTVTVTANATYRAYFAHDKYTVTGLADQGQGSVTGSGSYAYLSNAMLTAEPACGYLFDHWSNESTESTITFQVTGDVSYTAFFRPAVVDTVEIHDTTVVTLDTVFIPVPDTNLVPVTVYDTTTVDVTVFDTTTVGVTVFDTTTVGVTVFDTTTVGVTVFDTTTVGVTVFDTTTVGVTVYDTTVTTVPVTVYDTTVTTIPVTVYDTTVTTIPVTVYDTTITTVPITVNDTTIVPVDIFDTTHVAVTVFDSTLVPITDTLWLTEYIYDTVYIEIHDTIYIHDTVFVGINDVDALDAKIYANNGQIVVEGADGNEVILFDVTGRILARKRDEYTLLRFDIPASGTYLVKIGNHAARRIVMIR